MQAHESLLNLKIIFCFRLHSASAQQRYIKRTGVGLTENGGSMAVTSFTSPNHVEDRSRSVSASCPNAHHGAAEPARSWCEQAL